MYKVVEGQVPAINIRDFLTPLGHRRSIRAVSYKDHISNNIIERAVCNNTKGFKPTFAKSDTYKNSFFPRTAIDWNHLSDSVVQSNSVDIFKNSLCD